MVIKGNERPSQFELDKLNKKVHECQSKAKFDYVSVGLNQANGGSLADLNEIIYPLLAPVTAFTDVEITIIGAKGFSIDFKIPFFPTANAILATICFIDFKLLYKNGSQVKESSADLLETSPFFTRQQVNLVLSKGVRYQKSTCPLIFNRALLNQLMLFELTDSAVKYNMLAFEPTNHSLNSTVHELYLLGYGLRFDSKLFPLSVFTETVIIFLIGTMNLFEAAALKRSQVKILFLAVSRLRQFFHNNPNWLNEANKRRSKGPLFIKFEEPEAIKLMMNKRTEIGFLSLIESKKASPFDDTSFCIFYQIELYSLGVFMYGNAIETQAKEDCTCLLSWIYLKLWPSDKIEYSGACLPNSSLTVHCNFDNMSQRCTTETIEPLNYRTIYDTILGLEYFKYLADVWLVPLASVLDILANLLVIMTFGKIKRSPEYRRNKLTDKGRFMWEYTYYNSWFILFHSLIFLFGPLTTCIEVSGIYCSSFILTDFFRPFYLFIQKFLGNTFRLAANVSSTLFVLYRFGLNTDKLVRFRKVNPSRTVACIFILCLVLSVITLFVNEKFSVHTLSLEPVSYLLDIEFDILKSGLSLKILYFFNILMGTSMFTILNMALDLRLLFLLRTKTTDRPKEEAEKRITNMVVLNGLFSFLFRLPEMVSAFLLLVFAFDPKPFPVCILSVARYHSVCPILFSYSHFLLAISYLENLVLLYLFNPTFRKHFLSK
nr:G protein-coupled receptor [Proales similis]